MKGLLRSSPFMILCNRIRNFVSHTRGALHGEHRWTQIARTGAAGISQKPQRPDMLGK